MYNLKKIHKGLYHTIDERFAVLKQGDSWTVYTIDEWRYLGTGYSYSTLKSAVERYINTH